MQIKFVRSGGFAGMPGLNVEGTIDLNGQGAKITSNSGKYHRDLAPQEVEQLRSAADPARLSKAKAALASKSQKVYDAYQYDITVATQDGKIHKATFNAGGGEEVNQLVPGLGNLIGWIDDEAQKIRQQRLNDR